MIVGKLENPLKSCLGSISVNHLGSNSQAQAQALPLTARCRAGRAVLGAALQPGESWYVIHTQPHHEVCVQVHLQAQGFRSFLPLFRKTVRHARRLCEVSVPLFPRYLFVALDLSRDQWRSVNGTIGVTRLVMGGDQPQAVPAGVVGGLTAAMGADGHLQLGDGLAVGQQVRVFRGPFADLMGELVRIDGGCRVQILLRLLGGAVSVTLGRDALMAAD